MKRNLAYLLLASVAALSAACGSSKGNPGATSTPRALPAAVATPQQPQNIALGDPTFKALPGAKADFGRVGGTVYQIEMPDSWNGRLLLYMHDFQGLGPAAQMEEPNIRRYLIRNGWAWGESSYSSTSLVPGLAADETAALWDFFVQKYGRPARTYVTGQGMGGATTIISAERYGNRYDGALALCGYAGQTDGTAGLGDFFFAGAYLAGVTQAEFDAALASGQLKATADVTQDDFLNNPLTQLTTTRIQPALKDPALNKRFEDIMLDLTGGPRPFDREGFALNEAASWPSAAIVVSYGLTYNDKMDYKLGPLSDVSSADFNAGVIRAHAGKDIASFVEGNELTGALQIPLLTMHTTGTGIFPIDQEQILRRKVEAAGKGGLLVQRAVQDPAHCGFTSGEREKALEDLVTWVEKGKKPKGENLLVADLTNVGKFNLAPRFGSSEANKVKGADERITMTGTITLDGKPLDDGTMFALVRTGDLEQASCSFSQAPVSNGRYEMTVAGKGELAGCGAPGAEVYLQLYVPASGQSYTSQQTIPWPASGKQLTFDATFASAADAPNVGRNGSAFGGEVLDSSGKALGPGTVVEAYVGDTLCGVSGVAPVVMAFTESVSYDLWAVGPAACAKDAALSFKINGKLAVQTAVNDQASFHTIDLTLP
jgi:hypothetical protein